MTIPASDTDRLDPDGLIVTINCMIEVLQDLKVRKKVNVAEEIVTGLH